MTADPNGWPDASKPGAPLNPEQDGFHWVTSGADNDAFPAEWRAAGENEWGRWIARWVFTADDLNPIDCRYLGPCLTPAEVAALVAEARAKALEEAATVARRVPIPGDCGPAEAHGRMTGALAAAEAIRARAEEAPHE